MSDEVQTFEQLCAIVGDASAALLHLGSDHNCMREGHQIETCALTMRGYAKTIGEDLQRTVDQMDRERHEIDARDAELQRLRERVAELEGRLKRAKEFDRVLSEAALQSFDAAKPHLTREQWAPLAALIFIDKFFEAQPLDDVTRAMIADVLKRREDEL